MKAAYSVATLCRVLAVSVSGYYGWRQRLLIVSKYSLVSSLFFITSCASVLVLSISVRPAPRSS